MPSLHQLSTTQLRQALQLSEQIDKLQRQLEAILGGAGSDLLEVPVKLKPGSGGKKGRGGKRTMSPEGRAKIAAAARLRWAKLRAASGKPTAAKTGAGKAKGAAGAKKSGGAAANKPAAAETGSQKQRNMTPEAREKISVAMKARWEARKKGGA